MAGVNIKNMNYVPTLSMRSAELRGLEKLPSVAKDKLQPVFLFAPWPNAKSIDKSVEHLQQAFDAKKRAFFLDIDRKYLPSPKPSPKVREAWEAWEKLQNPEEAYKNWQDFIKKFPNASPCIQLHNNIARKDISEQIVSFQRMGRTFACRFELDNPAINFIPLLPDIVTILNDKGADATIIFDGGWLQPSETNALSLRIKSILRERMSELNSNIPIVISYTTMPKLFSNIKGIGEVSFDNHKIIQEMTKGMQSRTFIYGDWGSTKPRQSGIAQRPAPRIDIALPDKWVFSRNRKEEWDYQDNAQNIIRSNDWKSIESLPIWGVSNIKNTLEDPELGVHSAQSNVASRVNIHLYQQAFYNKPEPEMPAFEEEWEDL